MHAWQIVLWFVGILIITIKSILDLLKSKTRVVHGGVCCCGREVELLLRLVISTGWPLRSIMPTFFLRYIES
jgi:hypothetical protein